MFPTRTKASAQSFVQTPFLFYKPYSSVYFREHDGRDEKGDADYLSVVVHGLPPYWGNS